MRLRCAPPGVPATEIEIGVDVARELPARLQALGSGRTAFGLVDAAVAGAHAERVRGLAEPLLLAGGEGSKSFTRLEDTLRAMARAALDRHAVLVVVGGGSLGDLGGLAAALYARGIDLVLVPTTLLAMVDSSVGGKTAINLPEGKNLVGARHPARLVLVDFAFLATLPEVEFRSGLGEILKVAIGLSPELFALLEANRTALLARAGDVLHQAVALAIAAKIAVVERDFAEQGPRRLLNLGHTLGHALEAASGYTLPHGIAVARGVHFALDVAERALRITPPEAARARGLLDRFGFTRDPLPPSPTLLPYVRRDKKAGSGTLSFVIPTGIGQSSILRLAHAALADALAAG